MKSFRTARFHLSATITLLAAIILPFSSASAKDSRPRQPKLFSMFASEATPEQVVTALAATPDAWQTIQYLSYDKRREFTAVFTRMETKLDDDIRALNEKRATMKGDPREWDFAMKELNNARADVQSKVSDLSRATNPDAWTESRDRLGVAWDRAQAAIEKVRRSTTA